MLILSLWFVIASRNSFVSSREIILFQDVTNQVQQAIYMYHKGTRESVDCLDDIVLIQANDLENNTAIQHLKVRRNIRYDSQ